MHKTIPNIIVAGKAEHVLAAAYAAGRPVRFWLCVGGTITGCFRAKSGATVAVCTATAAHDNWPGTKDTSRVYFALAVLWANGSPEATLEAMRAYQAEEIARRNDDAAADEYEADQCRHLASSMGY